MWCKIRKAARRTTYFTCWRGSDNRCTGETTRRRGRRYRHKAEKKSMFRSFWAEAILFITYILRAGNTPYRKRPNTRTTCITPLQSTLEEGLHSRRSFVVKRSKQVLIEVLSRIAVRASMIWRPSSYYAKIIKPTTQLKQTNPQPNPNTTLLRTRY